MVEDPGTLTVTCDDCGETQEFDTTPYTGQPTSFGVEDNTIEDLDWTVEEGGLTYCPKCSEERAKDA